MHKSLGYIIALVGLVALGLSTVGSQSLQDSLGLDNKIADNTVMIVGIALIALGVLFIVKGTTQKGMDVPIYKGKHIVGYRRLEK